MSRKQNSTIVNVKFETPSEREINHPQAARQRERSRALSALKIQPRLSFTDTKNFRVIHPRSPASRNIVFSPRVSTRAQEERERERGMGGDRVGEKLYLNDVIYYLRGGCTNIQKILVTELNGGTISPPLAQLFQATRFRTCVRCSSDGWRSEKPSLFFSFAL